MIRLPRPPQRASDADRDTAVDMLCAAVADGRLTLTELEERVEAALSARTLTELAVLIADLDSRPPTAAGSGRARGDRHGAADRWSLLQSLAAR